MPVVCLTCRAELTGDPARCLCAVTPPAAECEVLLDFDGPLAKEAARQLLAEPGRSPAEIEILRAILDD